jgi:hypothetical protein
MGVPSNHPEVINDHFKIFVLKPIVAWGFPHDFHGQVLDFSMLACARLSVWILL